MKAQRSDSLLKPASRLITRIEVMNAAGGASKREEDF
jgi:hypothetical protein